MKTNNKKTKPKKVYTKYALGGVVKDRLNDYLQIQSSRTANIPTLIPTPDTTLTKNSIAEAKAQLASTNWVTNTLDATGGFLLDKGLNMASKGIKNGDLGTLFKGSGDGTYENDADYRDAVDSAPKMAMGGVVENPNVNINAEGGESIKMPGQQEAIAIEGASHAEGGVDMNVPEGSVVYSTKLKKDEESFAQREEARNNYIKRLEAQLEKNPTDKLLKQTLGLAKMKLAAVEKDDIASMQQAKLVEQQQQGYNENPETTQNNLNDLLTKTADKYKLGGVVSTKQKMFTTNSEGKVVEKYNNGGPVKTPYPVYDANGNIINNNGTTNYSNMFSNLVDMGSNQRYKPNMNFLNQSIKQNPIDYGQVGNPKTVFNQNDNPEAISNNPYTDKLGTHRPGLQNLGLNQQEQEYENNNAYTDKFGTNLRGLRKFGLNGLEPEYENMIKNGLQDEQNAYEANNDFKNMFGVDDTGRPIQKQQDDSIEAQTNTYNNTFLPKKYLTDTTDNTGAYKDAINNIIGGTNKFVDKTKNLANSVTTDGTTDTATNANKNKDYIKGKLKTLANLGGEQLNKLTNSLTAGDVVGGLGQIGATFDPTKNTLANRASDTANQNFFKDYGKKGLESLEKSKQFASSVKDNAILQTNNQYSNTMGRSANVNNAFKLAEQAGKNTINSNAMLNYGNMISGINGQISNMQNQQDQMVMQGEQTKVLADQGDRDNFYKQYAKDVETKNFGLQKMGSTLNQIKERNVTGKMVDKMHSDFGVNFMTGEVYKRATQSINDNKEFFKSVTPEIGKEILDNPTKYTTQGNKVYDAVTKKELDMKTLKPIGETVATTPEEIAQEKSRLANQNSSYLNNNGLQIPQSQQGRFKMSNSAEQNQFNLFRPK